MNAAAIKDLPMTGVVAVYGTLKRHHANHRRLRDSEFLGEGQTQVSYPMMGIDMPFPYLFDLPGQGLGLIKLELFSVIDPDVMRDLDRLEGHPNHYHRSIITVDIRPVQTPDKTTNIETFIYFSTYASKQFSKAEEAMFCTNFTLEMARQRRGY